MARHHTRQFIDVLAAERALVATHRMRRGVHGTQPLVGVALSGGGIRSAAFGMGVLQALHEGHVLDHVDYLSTVSGGGYIGSALTWFLRNGHREFPFGRSGTGARSHRLTEPDAVRDFIRQHGDYLEPRTGFDARAVRSAEPWVDPHAQRGGGLTLLSLFGVIARNLLLAVLVYGALLTAIFFALGIVDATLLPVKALLGVFARRREVDVLLALANPALLLSASLLAVVVLVSLGYGVMSFVVFRRRIAPQRRDEGLRAGYASRLRSERLMGRLWLGILGTLVVGSVPLVSLLLEQWLEPWARGGTSAASGLAGAWIGVRAHRRAPRAGAAGAPGMLGQAALPLGAFLLVYGLLLLTYTLAVAITDSRAVWAIGVVLAVGVGLGLTVDLNAVSLWTMYRDRLMEVFLPGASAVRRNEWRPAVEAAAAPLDEMCSPTTGGPYHLVNATVLTVASPKAKYRGRGADSFVLSPLFCGSDATGWTATSEWLHGNMTLASAMAISGAAVNPYGAFAGHGPTRGRFVSMFMTLLSLRLGYWAANPDPTRRSRLRRLPPSFLYPGLVQGLFGAGLAETKPFIELADGGDFENLGIYELVRREVDVIVVSDGSEDPNCAFDSLANAIERVRVDFGVRVEFADPERDVSALLPGSDGDDPAAVKYGLAKRGYAVARIVYPGHLYGAKEGVLVYLRPTLLRTLPVDLLGFKSTHPSYPHQTTADQFFDERHLEAYRELGNQLTTAMLAREEALVRRLAARERAGQLAADALTRRQQEV